MGQSRVLDRSEREQILRLLHKNGFHASVEELIDLLSEAPSGRLLRLIHKIQIHYRDHGDTRSRLIQIYLRPNAIKAYAAAIDYPSRIQDSDVEESPIWWISPEVFQMAVSNEEAISRLRTEHKWN